MSRADNKEKYKEYDHQYYIKHKRPKSKIGQAEQQISDLEAKLAESEKSKESYRLQNEHHHLQLLQFYSRLGVEAFGADIHEKALETLMIMKEQLAEKEEKIKDMKFMMRNTEQALNNVPNAMAGQRKQILK